MPRYHFNVYDGIALPDRTGTDLPDVDAARRTALRQASDILDDRATRSMLGDDWYMEVTNANGLILFRFDFHLTDAPVIRGGPDGKDGKKS